MPGVGIGSCVAFGGGGQFRPPSVPGNILWLRADMGITLNGADVAGWADQSGNGNDAAQGVAADQPAFEAAGGPNGTPCVTFDAANTEFLDLGAMTDASHDYTVFAVLNQTATAGTQTLLGSAAAQLLAAAHTATLAANDSTAWRDVVAAKTGEQIATWRLDATGTAVEICRDGTKLGSGTYDATWAWAAPELGKTPGGADHLDAKVAEVIVYNRKLSDAEVALVHAYLSTRYAITFSPLSVANCGAWWDLDHATVAGGVLTAITDRALGAALTVSGTPAVVSVGGQDFVRFDGVDDTIATPHAAALSGTNGVSFVAKYANCLPNPIAGTRMYMCKGHAAGGMNGGLTCNAAAAGRFTVQGQGGAANALGPLAEYTSPAETVAAAFDLAAAVRRVDGDGTYATNATAATGVAGLGKLSWGAWDNNAGGWVWPAAYDCRASVYYARPLNQYELEAVRDYLEAA